MAFSTLAALACGGSVALDPIPDGSVRDSAAGPASGIVRPDAGKDGSAGASTTPGTDPTTGGDPGPAPTGTTNPPGPADGGVACGNGFCASGQVCCYTPGAGGATASCSNKSCPDGGVAIACTGPSDCSGGGFCCLSGTIQGTQLTSSSGAGCKPTCASNIPLTPTGGSFTVRLCKAKKDCTEPQYGSCCDLSQAGFAGHACVSQQIATIAGLTCL